MWNEKSFYLLYLCSICSLYATFLSFYLLSVAACQITLFHFHCSNCLMLILILSLAWITLFCYHKSHHQSLYHWCFFLAYFYTKTHITIFDQFFVVSLCLSLFLQVWESLLLFSCIFLYSSSWYLPWIFTANFFRNLKMLILAFLDFLSFANVLNLLFLFLSGLK